MTSISSTILTIGGTPTIFLPVPSPYPYENGCSTNIYQFQSATFLAWDPIYGKSISAATSCFPPQVTSWWLQASDALIYTALGPTFACPEAYSTVSTNVVATSVEEVYCCPSYVAKLHPENPLRLTRLTKQAIHSPLCPAKQRTSLPVSMHLNALGEPDTLMVNHYFLGVESLHDNRIFFFRNHVRRPCQRLQRQLCHK